MNSNEDIKRPQEPKHTDPKHQEPKPEPKKPAPKHIEPKPKSQHHKMSYTIISGDTFWFVLPRPIIPLFKRIGSPETLSRDPRAPPESILLTWRNTTGPSPKPTVLLSPPSKPVSHIFGVFLPYSDCLLGLQDMLREQSTPKTGRTTQFTS